MQCHGTPVSHEGHTEHEGHSGHDPVIFRRKFWLSFLLSIPTLLYSDTIQEWFNFRMPAFPGSDWVPFIFGTVIFAYGGWVFLRGAQDELRERAPGMMTLIAMAITVAFGYSLAVQLGWPGESFFWELATLVTIMLFGHWMEMRSIQSAQGALGELAKLLPDTAERVENGQTHSVPTEELREGDVVLVRPGAAIPADGYVVRGVSEVNEAMLTGESAPIPKQGGDSVVGGTINGAASLRIQVTDAGEGTMLAGIMRLVEQAQSSQSHSQVLADRAAFFLTYIALSVAVITLAGWLLLSDQGAGFAIERMVTVLIIACPHALGLAIPLVVSISTTMAAKNGVLVRKRLALEDTRRINVVLFDKTGTLTRGEQGVVDILGSDTEATLRLAAAVESESEHAIARAIVGHAEDSNLDIPEAVHFTALPGRGARAYVGNELVLAGSRQLLTEQALDIPKELTLSAQKAAERGHTIVYVSRSEEVVGALALSDTIRDESYAAVRTLQDNGMRVAMLTGDTKPVADWVAQELGIDECFAEVKPEDKAATVAQLQEDGSRVAMVGDGVNDAPALTGADIGIAIGAGTDVAIESADIVLAASDPLGVVKILRLSKASYRKMWQNLAWAAGYNAFTLPLAAGVLAGSGIILAPAIGAILMSLSTIIVAVNAQFLRKLRLE